LRQFQVCTDVLGRELGTRPDTETRKLYESLLTTDSEAVPEIEKLPADGTAQAGSTPPAVAIMPFDNLAAPGDDYFADGMAEDLITELSCFPSLVVIARGSSFTFRDSELTDREIATALGAQYLVRGSVRRSGNRVRINVQLLDADAGIHLWGHRYDREMEDVFMLQDEITSTLVSTLAGRVEADRLARARKAPPERLDAHDLLLRGKDYHHRFTADDCQMCIEMFERAIDRDPDYAAAYAWLACGFGQAMVFGLDDIPKLVDKSETAAEKGLALDENDSECHRVLAQVSLARCNLKKAMHHQERALFLNPNDDRIVNAMGELLVFTGQAEEAEEWVRKSMRLNPYHPQRYLTHLVRALYHQGRYTEALEVLDQLDTPRKDDLSYRAAALKKSGRDKDAAAVMTDLGQQFPDFDPVAFAEAMPFQSQEYRTALSQPLANTAAANLKSE
jgi:adenylate cyclase